MGIGVYYRCWTVTCKTTGCNWLLFLDKIGPKDQSKHALLPPFEAFKITCPECKTEHSYGPVDVKELNLEDPPTDYRCREFQEALGKASNRRPPSSEDL